MSFRSSWNERMTEVEGRGGIQLGRKKVGEIWHINRC